MKIRNSFLAGVSALMAAIACLSSCQSAANSKTEELNIIFETDLGNDVDDALALDMLYKYMDEGRLNLKAVCINKEGTAPAEFLDIMSTWYGYPDVPVGIIRGGADCETDAVNYAKAVVGMQNEDGTPLFARSHGDYASYPDAHKLYRKVLSEMPDHSVTIVSVGFYTNLQRLLATEGDEYSPLNGYDLVAKKVKRLCTMAGCVNNPQLHEYNIWKDVPAAKQVFENWPTEIVTSPFEVGENICYPATSIENDFGWAENHPMVEAYKAYLQMPYDRPTWDLTAVLYAVEGENGYFSLSPKGRFEVTPEGYTLFTETPDGNLRYLIADEQQKADIKSRFVELLTTRPEDTVPNPR